MPEAKSEIVGATEVPLKLTPAWSDGNERHTISLFNAVCLLHNIRPSKTVLAKLREQKGPRALKFQNHLSRRTDEDSAQATARRCNNLHE